MTSQWAPQLIQAHRTVANIEATFEDLLITKAAIFKLNWVAFLDHRRHNQHTPTSGDHIEVKKTFDRAEAIEM